MITMQAVQHPGPAQSKHLVLLSTNDDNNGYAFQHRLGAMTVFAFQAGLF